MDCVYILHSEKLKRFYTGLDQEQNLDIRQIILFYSGIRLDPSPYLSLHRSLTQR